MEFDQCELSHQHWQGKPPPLFVLSILILPSMRNNTLLDGGYLIFRIIEGS